MALAISFLALIATFFQLYLQRIHNEKSLKPLIQIDLGDVVRTLFVRVQNNGVGPIIIDKLTFTKEGKAYPRIQDCLDLDARSYNHIEVDVSNTKVLIPGGFLEVFFREFDLQAIEVEIANFRTQLSALRLKVEGRDIYDNKVVLEKSLHWFVRHDVENR